MSLQREARRLSAYPGVTLGCRILYLSAIDLDLENFDDYLVFAKKAYAELCCLPDRSLRALAEFWGAERARKSHEIAQSILISWAGSVLQGAQERLSSGTDMITDDTIPAYYLGRAEIDPTLL